MENRLLRVLQLNSVLECLSYCEESGDLLLGIAGNLYRIPHKHLLPTESRTQDWDELSELPKMWSSRLECRASHNAKMLGPENIAENKYPELGALMERHKDLESLLKGEVDCKKKGRHTQQMKVEAFSNYLHLIYREPPKIRDKLVEMASWLNKDGEEGKDDTQTAPIAECKWRRTRPIQPAKKLKHLPPIKRPTPPMAPPPDPMPPSPPPTPCVPNTPPKPTRLPHTPITPSNPPAFLRQFLGEDWFLKIFPDPSCISSSVSPREFCSLLCDFMVSCSMTQKQSVLKALLMLLQQQVLDNEALCNRLHVCLQSCVHKHMSMEQQLFVSELLNLMAQLSPNSSVTIVELLAMLADKDRDLKTLALSVLKMLGVEEAELWLSPEVEFWTTSEQQLKSMRDKASHWLNTWTKKYKEHRKCLRSKTRMSPVEVLKYFCSVQRCKQKTEDDRNDAVLPPSGSFKSSAPTVALSTHADGFYTPPPPTNEPCHTLSFPLPPGLSEAQKALTTQIFLP
ncbi:hypothetical protein DNTS_027891 [Danionella cerebrum]|uniref:Uncharacterized protein n=1 Tax=Danionella cerebrum TaxID=2873325 RepID=A0A553RNW4_9TELE|nr:hypothetical protein DNTS_027891 [Danionella translucida]